MGGVGLVDTGFFDGPALSPGAEIEGPAVIAEPTTTVVLPPGARARLSGHMSYDIETGAAR